MSKKEQKKSDQGETLVRIMSLREGDIVLKSGKRLVKNSPILVTEDDAQWAEKLGGEFIKRLD